MRLALLFLIMAVQLAHSEEVLVAAAADLTYCVPEIDAAFQKANPGATVKVSFGSSGNFYSQIRNGAPFDVFLSADIKYPDMLRKDGFVEEPVRYAQGRLVLWTIKSGVDQTRGLAILRDAAIQHIALANPDHAPYGRAAKAVLEREHLWDELKAKLVFGENISQTAQFVETGNAEAGFVAMSLVAAPQWAHTGRYYEVPAEDYPAIDQAAALTKSGAGKPMARAYLAFLQSTDAKKIFEQYGFRLPK